MVNVSLSFWVDILGITIALLYTIYLIYVRVARESMKAKYEKYEELTGRPAHDMYAKLLDPRRLIFSIIITLYFTADLILREHESKSVDAGALIFIAILALIVLVLISIVAYFKFRQPKK